MPHPIYQVDAFTHRPFAGNPAAVCVLEGPAPLPWMQAVAQEMNLSETAFVHAESQADGDGYRLRWFTPTVEEELCGHATLASDLLEEFRVPLVDRLTLHLVNNRIVQEPDFTQRWMEAKHPEQLRDIVLLSRRQRVHGGG